MEGPRSWETVRGVARPGDASDSWGTGGGAGTAGTNTAKSGRLFWSMPSAVGVAGEQGGLDAAGAAQLGEDATHVGLDAGLGHPQSSGYRAVGQAVGEERHDLGLARREGGQARGRLPLSGGVARVRDHV